MPTLQQWAAIVGGSLIALCAATPNAFNAISGQFQGDTDTSDSFTAVFLGLGVAGLQLTLLGGKLLDARGPVVTCSVSGAVVLGGYFVLSFLHNQWAMLLVYTTVSVASGTCFLCALSTAIEIGSALGVGLVSLTMSLSISFTVFVTKTYASHCSLDDDHCWRNYVRLYAVVAFSGFAVGTLGLAAYSCGRSSKPAPPRAVSTTLRALSGSATLAALQEEEAAQPRAKSTASAPAAVHGDDSVVMSLLGGGAVPADDDDLRNTPLPGLLAGLKVFRKPAFLMLFYINLTSMGAGIVVISSAQQIFTAYNNDNTKVHWNQQITTYFSVFAGAANVISPVFSGYLHDSGRLSRPRFLGISLAFSCVFFLVLAIFNGAPHDHHGGCAMKMAFVMLMASVGYSFGTGLTLIPTMCADLFGVLNLGVFLSYTQLGSAGFAAVLPVIATSINSSFGSYSAVLWGTCGMLLVSALLCTLLPREAGVAKSAPINV